MKHLLKFTFTVAIMFLAFSSQAYNFSVSGLVTNAQTQQPVPGIMVKLHIMGAQIFETMNTGDDGTFAFSVEIADSTELEYALLVYPVCVPRPIFRTGAVTPDGVVENFEICGQNNTGCHADFFFHHTEPGGNPLEIVFTNHSFSPDSIAVFAWDFGDGTTSSEANPLHTFAAYGSYDVTLVITSVSGCTDDKVKTVVIEDQTMNCHADFFFHHTGGPNGNPAEFEFTNTSHAFSPIVTFAWDFGDGTTSAEENPTHLFAEAGNYTVTLVITTESGCTDDKTKTVVVHQGGGGQGDCEADFEAHQPPNHPMEVHFFDKSDFQPGSWAWEFGDGETSGERNPDHTYAAGGEYTVSLTITSADSICVDTYTEVVVVEQFNWGCEASFDAHQSNHHPMKVYFHDKSQFQHGTWFWEFGDGETSTFKNPEHLYAAGGEYTVNLTITSADSTCVDTYSEVVVVEQFNWGCEANFDFHQSWHHPMVVHFFDKSQFQPGTWTWEFGDGETSSERNPFHTYAAGGEYTVTLTINSADSTCVDTYSEAVIIEELPDECHANFWWHHNCQSQNPLEIQFIDHSYTYSPIVSYTWDFGDGATSEEENPVHLYPAFGLYNVSLAITTESGCASDRTYQVWVRDASSSCLALFVPVIDSANTLLVHFQDLSLGDITSWAWDFGDGITSNEQNPDHEYAEPAVFTVTLTVTSENCTSSFYYDIDLLNGQVMVNPGPATGINETSAIDVQIFPNPVEDILNININTDGDFEAQIINLTGQVIRVSKETSINVSDLPKGVYFLNVKYNGQNLTKKFIK